MKAFSKLLAAFMVVSFVITALQSTAFASEADATATPAAETVDAAGASVTPAPYGVEVALYLMESNNNWSYGDIAPTEWSEPKSESVFIKEDGTYTVSLADLDIPSDTFMLCYIKDVAAYPKSSTVTHSNVPDDLMVITDVFKVNGSVKEVDANKVRTGLKKGIFDVAYRNNWDANDDCVAFTTDIKSIEITFTVTGITGEPGAIKYEPTQAAPTTAVTTPTAIPAAAASADNKTDKSSSTAGEDEDAGSNLPFIIGIGAAVLISFVVILVVRKKK